MRKGSRLFAFCALSVSLGLSLPAALPAEVREGPSPPAMRRYLPDEIIVKFRKGVPRGRRAALHARLGARELDASRFGHRRMRIPRGKTVAELLERYRRDPDVEYAEPNYIAYALWSPDDEHYNLQWHFDNPVYGGVNAEAAWEDFTAGDPSVVVAVLDTGVAYENYVETYTSGWWWWTTTYTYHYVKAPDLAGTAFADGYDFANDDAHANDDHGHGTHVTGTIAQTTDNGIGAAGLAHGVTIMPVKVLDSGGSGSYFDVAQGVIWAVDNGAQVINMSLGGSSSSSTLHDALQYAHANGVTTVCAAGNNGSSSLSYPGAYSECIAVGATGYDETLAPYSNYGSGLDIVAPGGNTRVDLNGDGEDDGVLQQTFEIRRTGNDYWFDDFGYYLYQGTSMATPHVAAAAAMLIANNIAFDPDDIRERLEETAEDLGAPGWDIIFGHGLLDVAAALGSVAAAAGPVAEFSADSTSGTAPLTVNFTDQSTNSPTSWSWDFGEAGGTSTEQDPSYTYDTPGQYTVSLSATNADGSDVETKVNYITVNVPPAPPVAEFSADPTSGDAPLTVNFTDFSTNTPTSWSWSFGDGGTSTAQNPSHTYNSDGTFTVTLTATNGDGSDVETKVGYVTVNPAPTPPVADFSGSPTSGTAPLTVNFTDSSTNTPTSWSWSFGDGGTSTSQNPSHTYNSDGSFTVTLTATNGDGSDVETKAGYITVDPVPTPPVADFSADDTSGEAPFTVNFTDLSTNTPTSWSWSFGDGGTSTSQNPSHTYNSDGSFTVTLTATNADGSDVETKAGYITVDPVPTPPTAAFAGSPTGTNTPTSWSWAFGDGGTSTVQNPSHTYGSDGTFTVTLTATNADGSDGETKVGYITVDPVPTPPTAAFAGSPTSGTAPLTVSFTDQSTNSPTSWSWTFGDGGTSTAQSPSHTYGSEGTFTVTLTATNADGSDGETKVNYITVDPVPTPPVAAFAGSPTGGTAPLTVSFTDQSTNSPTSWSWAFGDGGTSTVQNPSHTYGSAGTFTVALTATNGDGSDGETKADYVTVNPAPTPPTAAFTGSPTGGTAPLTVSFTDQSTNSPTSWSWAFGDGGTSTVQNPSHQYTAPGTYTVALTATNGDGSDGETKAGYVTVDPVPTPPTAAFTGSPTGGTAPLTVSFTDLSTNTPTSWSWSFGDGGTSTSQNPSHTYGSEGSFTVTLTATNADGSDVETKAGYITVDPVPTPPVADFSGTPRSGTGSLEVSFTDLSTNTPTSWSWSFGDGGTSTSQNPSHTYGSDGTFTVTLTATNADGSDVETKAGYITVDPVPTPPVADFSGTPRSGTGSLEVSFTDLSTNTPTSWSWSFGDGGTSTSQNPSHTYGSDGTFTVTLTATNADGSDGETKAGYITVDPVPTPPTAAFTGSPTGGTAPLTVSFTDQSTNSPTSWSWTFGDGGTSTAQNPTYTYNTPGTYTVMLTATNADGSDGETKTNYITVDAPPSPGAPVASFTRSPTYGYRPLTVFFSDTSTGNITGWLWNFGDGTTSTEQNPVHSFSTSGLTWVTLTVSGPDGSDSVQNWVYPF